MKCNPAKFLSFEEFEVAEGGFVDRGVGLRELES